MTQSLDHPITSPPHPSLWRRLRTTPLRDLARLRLTGRLDIHHKLAAAGLSPEETQLVQHVIKRTRLRRAEKADVADELIAHFLDAIDAKDAQTNFTPADFPGSPADESESPAARFGDPRATARLIRRAKLRQRGLPWQAFVWSRRAVAALVVFYLFVVIRFYSGSPRIAVDYVARVNASIEAVPEEDRAWPILREALLKRVDAENFDLDPIIPRGPDGGYLPDIAYLEPGWPGWDEAGAWLEEHQFLIEAAWRASSKTVLGMKLPDSASIDPLDSLLFYGPEGPTRGQLEAASGSLLTAYQYLGYMRMFGRLLEYDADHAMARGDDDRTLRDLRAIHAMGKQIVEVPQAFNGLIALSTRWSWYDTVEQILLYYPGLLSDQQWSDLAHVTASGSGRDLVRVQGERMVMDDLIQRLYTDDGQGGGYLNNSGYATLGEMNLKDNLTSEAPRFEGLPSEGDWLTPTISTVKSAAETAAQPASLLVAASRREVKQHHDALMDLFEDDLRTPMRDRVTGRMEQVMLDWSELEQLKYAPIQYLFQTTGLEYLRRTVEQSEARREAILIGIGLELYRRDHGNWPTSLDTLSPRYIPVLPVDPITGQPLRYRLVDDRPLVYSVGGDRDDDGGRLPVNEYDAQSVRNAMWWDDRHAGNPEFDGDWVLYPSVD